MEIILKKNRAHSSSWQCFQIIKSFDNQFGLSHKDCGFFNLFYVCLNSFVQIERKIIDSSFKKKCLLFVFFCLFVDCWICSFFWVINAHQEVHWVNKCVSLSKNKCKCDKKKSNRNSSEDARFIKKSNQTKLCS